MVLCVISLTDCISSMLLLNRSSILSKNNTDGLKIRQPAKWRHEQRAGYRVHNTVWMARQSISGSVTRTTRCRPRLQGTSGANTSTTMQNNQHAPCWPPMAQPALLSINFIHPRQDSNYTTLCAPRAIPQMWPMANMWLRTVAKLGYRHALGQLQGNVATFCLCDGRD